MTAEAVALVVRERGAAPELADVRVQAPGAGFVRVRIRASGVCPTDLFAIDGGAGDVFPAVFGHEGAGIVEAVGEGVSHVRAGDRVALSFDSCGRCAACGSGHPASCDRFAALNYRGRLDEVALAASGEAVRSGWMAQSSWATHVLAPARAVVPIGADVPWEVAATLGCGVLTGAGTVFNVLAPGPGDALLVVGAGTTGLAAVMAARHRSVGRIVVIEPDAARRALAIELGATAALAPGEAAGGVTGGATPDGAVSDGPVTHALDTFGTQSALDAALGALAVGGTLATVALKPGANPVEVSQSRLLWGRGIRGVIEGDADPARDVPRLAALWRAGRLPVEHLVRRYAFADAATAVADARTGAVVKAVLVLGEGAEDAPSRPQASNDADLLATLREGGIPDADLAPLWRSLPPVEPAELRGLWRGFAATRDHAAGALLAPSGWYGKLFDGPDDIVPIVRLNDDGSLAEDRSFARGGASLRIAEHDGIRTAAMLYDARPLVDLFVRLAPDAVLGVMTGRGTLDGGRAFHFVLERDPAPRGVARSRR